MQLQMVDLKGQYQKIKDELDSAIQNVINDAAFIKGKYVQEFCTNLEAYLDVKHVIPCGNGTDALQLALMALDLKPGDEVITTPFTFVATAETIVLLGLKPVFVDIDPESFNIDASRVEAVITEKTKCIIPVHLFGQSADMTEIMAIAEKYNLAVIEETAQAIGAHYFYNGQRSNCGTIGNIGTLSFFPSKNLGCYGDGGAVMTNDSSLAHKINLYANHGSTRKYYYDEIGINSRLDGIQAAVLNVKLKYLDEYNEARQKAAEVYDYLLSEVEEIQIPVIASNRNHVYHQYTLKIKEGRDRVQAALKEKGIPSAIYYPAPLYTQSIYQAYKSQKEDYAITESLCNSVLSLPMHTELNEDMQRHIVDAFKSALVKSMV